MEGFNECSDNVSILSHRYGSKVNSILEMVFLNSSIQLIYRWRKLLFTIIESLISEASISPRIIQAIPNEILQNKEFHNLLTEIGTDILIGPNAIEFLQLIYENPDFFIDIQYIYQNSVIQENLRKLLQFHENSGQGYILKIIQHFIQ